MALAPILPKPTAKLVTAAGLTTPEWYDFLRLLRSFVGDNIDLAADLDEIERRLDALEEGDDLPQLRGLGSIRITGTLADSLVQFFLDGDEAEPGNTYFYGTGPDGVKGFFPIASAVLGEDSVVADVGTDGIVTFHLDGDAASPGTGYTYATHLTTGVKGWYRPALFESTGLLDGGTLAINAGDNTKFDVAAAVVGYTDYSTSPANPARAVAIYGPSTGNSVPSLAVIATYVGIQTPGLALAFSTSPFTATQRRTIVPLGAVISNGVQLIAVNNLPDVMRAGINQFQDLLVALGPINVAGNVFGPNGANLQLNKSAGTLFKQGANFANNEDDPHNLVLPSLTAPATIQYRTSTGTASANTNAIDVTQYESAPGVLSEVPNNRFTIQRITLFTSNLVRIQYGQHVYQTMAEAEALLTTESFTTEQNIAENGSLRCFLIVEKNATDLSNPAQAKFIPASKFGGALGSGGTSITSTDSLPEGVTNLYYTDERVDDRANALISAQDYLLKNYDDTLGQMRLYGLNPYATYVVDSSGNYLRDSSGNLLTTDNDGFPIPQALGGTGVAGAGTKANFLRGDGSYAMELVTTANPALQLIKYSNDAAGPQTRWVKYRGTEAVPAAVQTNDVLMPFQARGGLSTAGVISESGNVGSYEILAAENFTNTGQGTYGALTCTPNGTTVRADQYLWDDISFRPASTAARTLGTTALRWLNAFLNNLNVSGTVALTGSITPAALTVNTDNYNPAGNATAYELRLSATGAVNLTGLVAGIDGQEKALANVGANTITLKHDTTSTAANRFAAGGNADVLLRTNGLVRIRYDGTAARWRILGP